MTRILKFQINNQVMRLKFSNKADKEKCLVSSELSKSKTIAKRISSRYH